MSSQRTNRIIVSERDIANAKGEVESRLLKQHLERLYEQTYGLLERVDRAETQLRGPTGTVGGLTEEDRRLLKAIAVGSTDTPVTTRPIIPSVSALPPTSTATPGEMVEFGGTVYRYSSSSGWVAISAAVPANMMTTDTDQTPGATVKKTWTAQQPFNGGLTSGDNIAGTKDVNGNFSLILTNPNAGASAQTFLRVVNDLGKLIEIAANSSGKTAYGCISAGDVFIYGNSTGATDLVSESGLIKFGGAGGAELARLNATGLGIGTTGAAAKLAINGGLHVGGDSDPGDNNVAIDGLATAYDSRTTAGKGVVPIFATSVANGLTAAVAEYTVYTVPLAAGGLYRVSYYIYVTTVGNAVNANLIVKWTDPAGNTVTETSNNLACGAATGVYVSKVLPVLAGSGTTIRVSTTLSGAIGAGVYAYYVVVEQLG